MRILRKCEVCGEEFIATKITNKYCSKRCARVVHRKKEAEKKKKSDVFIDNTIIKIALCPNQERNK